MKLSEIFLEQAKDYSDKAAALREELDAWRVRYKDKIFITPVQRFMCAVYCVLPIAPVFFDTIFSQVGARDFMARYLSVTDPTLRLILSILISAFVTFGVWFLAYAANEVAKPSSALAARMGALIFAVAFPVVTIFIMNAEASIAFNKTGINYWDAMAQQGHLIVFVSLSLGFHLAIATKAVQITELLSGLPIRWKERRLVTDVRACEKEVLSLKEQAAVQCGEEERIEAEYKQASAKGKLLPPESPKTANLNGSGSHEQVEIKTTI